MAAGATGATPTRAARDSVHQRQDVLRDSRRPVQVRVAQLPLHRSAGVRRTSATNRRAAATATAGSTSPRATRCSARSATSRTAGAAATTSRSAASGSARRSPTCAGRGQRLRPRRRPARPEQRRAARSLLFQTPSTSENGLRTTGLFLQDTWQVNATADPQSRHALRPLPKLPAGAGGAAGLAGSTRRNCRFAAIDNLINVQLTSAAHRRRLRPHRCWEDRAEVQLRHILVESGHGDRRGREPESRQSWYRRYNWSGWQPKRCVRRLVRRARSSPSQARTWQRHAGPEPRRSSAPVKSPRSFEHELMPNFARAPRLCLSPHWTAERHDQREPSVVGLQRADDDPRSRDRRCAR